jgi:hypothetical protein
VKCEAERGTTRGIQDGWTTCERPEIGKKQKWKKKGEEKKNKE